MASAADIFGASNSDDALVMEHWLTLMCQGCVKDRGRAASGGQGGMSCEHPITAYLSPDVDIPAWSPDATPKPARLLGRGGMGLRPEHEAQLPVCLDWRPRKKRSDAGRPRVPAGQEALL